MKTQPKCLNCNTPLVPAIEIGLCAYCCEQLPKEVAKLKSKVEELHLAVKESVRTNRIGWLQEINVDE